MYGLHAMVNCLIQVLSLIVVQRNMYRLIELNRPVRNFRSTTKDFFCMNHCVASIIQRSKTGVS